MYTRRPGRASRTLCHSLRRRARRRGGAVARRGEARQAAELGGAAAAGGRRRRRAARPAVARRSPLRTPAPRAPPSAARARDERSLSERVASASTRLHGVPAPTDSAAGAAGATAAAAAAGAAAAAALPASATARSRACARAGRRPLEPVPHLEAARIRERSVRLPGCARALSPLLG